MIVHVQSRYQQHIELIRPVGANAVPDHGIGSMRYHCNTETTSQRK